MGLVTEKKLRSSYIASLLVKMESICGLWRKYNAINGRKKACEELLFLIHNLYTSACMHGLYSLAGSAKTLEKTLNNKEVTQSEVVDCLSQLSKEIWLAQKLLPREKSNNE